MEPAETGHVRVLFDRECGFCRWSVAVLLSLDGGRKLEPVAIQSAVGQSLLAGVPEADRLESAHAVAQDGVVLSGGDAAPLIARSLRFGRPVAWLASSSPSATRAAYRAVASNRASVGRLVGVRSRSWADRLLQSRIEPGSA